VLDWSRVPGRCYAAAVQKDWVTDSISGVFGKK